MTRSPFFVGFLSLSLLATVDIMLSSLCCFTIVVLIDGPRGPPPATPGPVTRDSMSSEKISLAVVAKTGPAPESVAAKRTPQVDLDADLKPQAAKRCRAGRTDSGAISSD